MNKLTETWVPFIFLVFLVIGVFIGVYYYSNPPIQSPNEPQQGCVPIKTAGSPEENVDIVFLETNYKDLSKFNRKTEEYVSNWNIIEPHNEFDNFNFYRIENNQELGCEYDQAVICDNRKVKEAAKLCPHDYIVVLADVNGIERLDDLLRSSAWLSVVHLNTQDDWLVFPHEMAHVIYDFADEYDYAGPLNWNAPNCDNDLQECIKFSAIDNYGCFLGCSDLNHAREEKTGIMRNYWTGSKQYGDYNEEYIRHVLRKITVPNEIGNSYSPAYMFNVDCFNDNCQISSIEETEGYSDGSNVNPSNNRIYLQSEEYVNIGVSNNYFSEYQDLVDHTKPKSYSFSMIAPKEEIGEIVELVKEENGVSEIIDTVNVQEEFNNQGNRIGLSLSGKSLSIPNVS